MPPEDVEGMGFNLLRYAFGRVKHEMQARGLVQ